MARFRFPRTKYEDDVALNINFKELEQHLNKLYAGVVFDGFIEENLAASQTDLQLQRYIVGTAPLIMPFAGNVLGIGVTSSEARTAGTATFSPFKNGTILPMVATLDATATIRTYATTYSGDMHFVVGDYLDIRVTTTAAWAPTTADVEAYLFVELYR